MFLKELILCNCKVDIKMDRLLAISVIGVILGLATFLGFFLSSFYNYNFLGVPFLSDFLAMCGLIIFFISVFLLVSLKAPRYNE